MVAVSPAFVTVIVEPGARVKGLAALLLLSV